MIDFSGQNANAVLRFWHDLLGRISPVSGIWIANMACEVCWQPRLSRGDEYEAELMPPLF